jgi:hypothetical protein
MPIRGGDEKQHAPRVGDLLVKIAHSGKILSRFPFAFSKRGELGYVCTQLLREPIAREPLVFLTSSLLEKCFLPIKTMHSGEILVPIGPFDNWQIKGVPEEAIRRG